MASSNINNLAKISIIGHPAVGKTTMLKLLSKNTIEPIYIPTQGFDLKNININNCNIKIWDFGGQKAYISYLEDYLAGSDLVFIVTDSSPRNVLKSRQLIELTQDVVESECPIIAIANKQDLCTKDEGRMTQKLVEDLLQIKTYGLSAINPSERTKLINIIKKELDHVLARNECDMR
jgi:small GTP-binding protein